MKLLTKVQKLRLFSERKKEIIFSWIGAKTRLLYTVIENLLEDSVKGNVGADGSILEEVLINTVKAVIKVMPNSVKDAASRMTESRFALIMPITRPYIWCKPPPHPSLWTGGYIKMAKTEIFPVFPRNSPFFGRFCSDKKISVKKTSVFAS